jgi:hypothetical protein
MNQRVLGSHLKVGQTPGEVFYSAKELPIGTCACVTYLRRYAYEINDAIYDYAYIIYLRYFYDFPTF